MRTLGKWFLRVAVALLILAALYVGLIAFPSPLFAHESRFGEYRVYSDESIPPDFEHVIKEAERRGAAMDPVSSRKPPRIFLCGSRKRYAFFAFLTRMDNRSLAISLSVTNEMFISMSRVDEFRVANRGRLRHTRFEGNPAEVIAHEVAHFNSVDALGYRLHLAQPRWKSEGWAEYQANLAAIRDDPEYDLHARIDLLLDDRFWSPPDGLAREMWEWQVLVEYLGEVQGFSLTDLSRDEVTRLATRDQMLAWHREEKGTFP